MALPKYTPHYSVADYQQWEGDWELWNGVAVAMTPSPFGRHQWVAGQWIAKLTTQLEAIGCRDCYVLGETDWIIASDTVVRPDVSLICGKFPERHIERPPVLILEILSESTADKDRTAKHQLYEREGVQYYFLIDPNTESSNTQSIEPYELHDGHYRPLPTTSPLQLTLHPNCQITLPPLLP